MSVLAYEIASDQYIALRAEQTVGIVRSLIQQILPVHALVIRSIASEPKHYALFRSDDLLYQIANAPDSVRLEHVLRLDGFPPLPVIDGYASAISAPYQCLVTIEDRIIGIIDSTIDPIKFRAAEDDHSVLEQNPKVVSSIRFATEMHTGLAASLAVTLTLIGGEISGTDDQVPMKVSVDIFVLPLVKLKLKGASHGRLMLVEGEEIPPLLFEIEALEPGQGILQVEYFSEGTWLGRRVLGVSIAELPASAAPATPKDVPRKEHHIALATETQPDLSVVIYPLSKHAFTVELTTRDAGLGQYHARYGPIELTDAPSIFVRSLFAEIERLPLERLNQHEVVLRKLAQIGAWLYENLLPSDLRTTLREVRHRINTVHVISDEPWIPWELLRLYEDGDEHIRDRDTPVFGFLCERFVLTRWIPSIPRRINLNISKLALVALEDKRMSGVLDESTYLLGLQNAHRSVNFIPPRYQDVFTALARGDYDCWHYMGHGHMDPNNPLFSTIALAHGETLKPIDISGEVNNLRQTQPLVFLHACQSGRMDMGLVGQAGWAQQFLQVGAASFIGTLWSVTDQAAAVFTRSFYDTVMRGGTVGRAVQESRLAVRRTGDVSWLAYTVFADPSLRML